MGCDASAETIGCIQTNHHLIIANDSIEHELFPFGFSAIHPPVNFRAMSR